MAKVPSRAEFAADMSVGTGNVLTALVARGAGLDVPAITFDTDVDGHDAWKAMTLRELDRCVRARAAALHAAGVGRRDPVAVYVSDVADQVLSFLALARLGAIPALINGAIAPDLAGIYIGSRLRAGAVLTDASHRRALDWTALDARPLPDVRELGRGDPDQAPPPFRHQGDDPAVITHSSGTTGIPKAVIHSHHSLFAGIRHRLTLPKPQGLDRTLSALPSPHAATVLALNLGLSSRVELAVLCNQRGDYVLDAIERWQPGCVLGFSTTWAELAAEDLSARKLECVRTWWNTGDCAHEAHVRRLVAVGSRDVPTRDGVVRKPGSNFVDGLGSTEMGHSQFFITHTPDTNHYGRCIGRPHSFSEIGVFDENGEEVPIGEIGELAIKAPTLPLGYWNDSEKTYRTRLNGFFLSGDLVYRDEAGFYYQVDRLVDSVRLPDGRWIYTALSEERVLSSCPDVLDCTVLPVRDGDTVTTTVLCTMRPGVSPLRDPSDDVRAALEDHVAATVTKVLAIPLDRLPVTATGKVRKVALRESYQNGELFSSIGEDAAVSP